jgi:AcrR family transcriptional regulator
MARPKNSDAEATQKAILAAAEQEFGDKGYAGARVTAIARRAGVTHAMLNYYFGGKAKLYHRVIERNFAPFAEVLATRMPTGERLALRDIVGDALDVLWQHPIFVQLMLWEMVSKQRRSLRATEKFVALVESVIAGLPASSKHMDARDLYVTLLGALVAYFFRDPVVERLFGVQRFREIDRARRRAHLVQVVDRLIR